MSTNLVLAGMVSNEDIQRAVFVIFVVIPSVLIASVIATIKSRSRIIPVAAGIGAACGPLVAIFFDGYSEMMSLVDVLGVAVGVAALCTIPGAAVGLVVWCFYFGQRWLKSKFVPQTKTIRAK